MRRVRWASAAIILTIWRRRATSEKSCHLVWHLPQLRLGRLGEVGDYRGIAQVGLSPFAERWAKARTCAGLTTTTGRPAQARPLATTASKPPVASIAAGWTNRHVQPIL
jgi:hypothetical protein